MAFKTIKRSMGWLILTMILFCSPVGAETVYKCVQGGKVNFTSQPPADRENCQPVDIKAPQPNPAETARLMEEKRRQAEKERSVESRKGRSDQAKEKARRERLAERELRLLSEPTRRSGGYGRRRAGSYSQSLRSYRNPTPATQAKARKPATSSSRIGVIQKR